MQSLISSLRRVVSVMMATGLFVASPAIYAADDPDAAITIMTGAYENSGVDNLFTICFDTNDAMYMDVDCGFGSVEYEIEPSEEGTWIPCSVTPEGMVRIYTDHPELINYMYCQGGHITDIDLSKLTGLEILDLSNNKLGKIDLSCNNELKMISLGTNPFDVEPLYIGSKPNVVALELEGVGHISPDFNLSDFPRIISFSAFSSHDLRKIDPTGCPVLQRLSIDVTSVADIDVSQNPELRILNISDTPIKSVDLSHNPKLQQLFVGHEGSFASGYKFTSLDVSRNPNLVYLFAQGNALTSIDISNNPNLVDVQLAKNCLEAFDYSANKSLYNVNISNNCLDYASLPLNPPFSGEYYYQQKSMPVELSYPVGASIDLSGRVLREGTQTSMCLYARPKDDPMHPVVLPDNIYAYSDGKITFIKEYADSVFASFSNPSFPECELTTTNFMIKTEEAYGKPVRSVSFSLKSDVGESVSFGIGVSGASESNPVSVYVDFGDGVLVPMAVNTQSPENPNVSGNRAGYGNIGIYVNDGQPLTALKINGTPLYDIDLTDAPELRELELTGTDLPFINLRRQRCLQWLKMSGNRFRSLDLSTDIVGYNKNVLSDVDLSGNQLEEINVGEARCWKRVNLSHNLLSDVALDKAYDMTDLDISYNRFTEFNFSSLDSLSSLNVAGNYFRHIDNTWTGTLRNLDCRENNLFFGTLPFVPGELSGEYLYAPQRELTIGTKGPGANLADVAAEIDGIPTEYVWTTEDGAVLSEGKDYEMTDGKVRFLDFNVGDVSCAMTNGAYPDFSGDLALRTSWMLVAPPPTNEIGWVEVADNVAGEYGITLIGASDNSSVYIDWGGAGKFFDEYLLASTYRMFKINPVAGARAKIYTYDDARVLSGFSLRGLPLKAADLTDMRDLTLLTLDDAGFSSLKMPDTDNLTELSLDNNGLSVLDASRLGKLRTLSLLGNRFETFDLTQFPMLEVATLSYNGMTDLTLGNPKLWHLDVSHNDFESFSFKNLPALHQASLADNRLESIDIDGPALLRVLLLDNNRLNYQTLPVPTETLTNYTYANQAPLSASCVDMTVDLSWLYEVHGEYSEFYWCQDEPYLDEDYSLYGYFLQPDVDYVENEGVTTFLHEVANVCGVILSPVFPKTYLLTEMMNITESGIASVTANAAISVDGRTLTITAVENTEYVVCDISGRMVASGASTTEPVVIELPDAGVYVVKAGKASMKIAVK